MSIPFQCPRIVELCSVRASSRASAERPSERRAENEGRVLAVRSEKRAFSILALLSLPQSGVEHCCTGFVASFLGKLDLDPLSSRQLLQLGNQDARQTDYASEYHQPAKHSLLHLGLHELPHRLGIVHARKGDRGDGHVEELNEMESGGGSVRYST